jgi:multiple sugar transport system permease protein
MSKPTTYRRARKYLLPIIGFVIAAFFLAPYAVMFLSSLKDNGDLFASPAVYLPHHWVWDNWVKAFTYAPLAGYLRVSLIVAGAGTALVLVVSMPAAYYTARFRFRGRSAYLYLVLITQMFAPTALVIGIYREFFQLHLTDSLVGLIIADAAFNLAFSVWILQAYFGSIPKEIEEAAQLDGTTRLQALRRVIIPIAAPGVVTAVIFTFIAIWNEFVVALTLISSANNYPLTVGLNSYIGEYQVEYQYLFVASVVAIVPVVVLFAFIERFLVRGLTAGGVK